MAQAQVVKREHLGRHVSLLSLVDHEEHLSTAHFKLSHQRMSNGAARNIQVCKRECKEQSQKLSTYPALHSGCSEYGTDLGNASSRRYAADHHRKSQTLSNLCPRARPLSSTAWSWAQARGLSLESPECAEGALARAFQLQHAVRKAASQATNWITATSALDE